jgi:FCP1-like phosphatase family protein
MSKSHSLQSPATGVLFKWLVSNNQKVQVDQAIAQIVVSSNEEESNEPILLKSVNDGNLKRIATEGQKISCEEIIGEIIECTHPAVFRNLCVSCGKKIVSKEANNQTPPSHGTKLTMAGGQTIQLSKSEAKETQNTKLTWMKKNRKLALILDLDSTLVHATSFYPFPQEILDQVKTIQLEDNGFILRFRSFSFSLLSFVTNSRHLVKLRPHIEHFLESCRPLFQMTIYTHGTRAYAEATARLLDPEGVYFGKRIVSRTDHPDLGLEKCLSRLFLQDWSMAVVLDDRDDVWKKDQQSHVICIRPYLYFQTLFPSGAHVAEVNNAAGVATVESLVSGDSGSPRSPNQENKSSPVDDDVGLLKSLDSLQALHTKYYELMDEDNSSPKCNVGTILQSMRRSVLKGCHLCFSGLISPKLRNPQQHKLWIIATNLGARVTLKLTSQTTHLLTTSVETEKSKESLKLGNIYICHPDWLLNCHWHILREDEILFLIAPIANPPVIDPASDDEGNGEEKVAEEDGAETKNESIETDEQKKKRSRPVLNRSEAGEYGVNYNSSTESDDSNSSDNDDDDQPRRKFRRFYTLDQSTVEETEARGGEEDDSRRSSDSGESSDVDESWIQSIEDEILEGEGEGDGEKER